MKIITHNLFELKNRRQDIFHEKGGTPPVYRRASGGEDFLDISAEAERKYRAAEVISLAEYRLKKENIGADGKSLSENRAAEVKTLIKDGSYDFDSAGVLEETSERLAGFLL